MTATLPASLDEAIQQLAREPDSLPALWNICKNLIETGCDDAVLPWSRRALAIDAHEAHWVTITVNALNFCGRHAEAAALVMRERASLTPAHQAGSLGYSLMMAGDLVQATAVLDHARRIAAESTPALLATVTHLYGEALLKNGDPAGFRHWAHRLKEDSGTYRYADIALWRENTDLRGKRVLVTHQLGFGDQFLLDACLADWQAAGATLAVTCDPQIHALMQASLPDCVVVSAPRPLLSDLTLPDDARQAVDAFAPDLQVQLLHVPVRAPTQRFRPYMRAPAEKQAIAADWSRQLRAAHPGKKLIGLFWDCAQRHQPDLGATVRCWAARRSFPLALIDRLVLNPQIARRVHFVNLQHPLVEADAGTPAGDVSRYAPGVHLFDDTAACIGELDGAIAVDSSVANLVAMMGVPACVPVSTSGDWRWGSSGAASPWIDNVTVCRQRDEGDWLPVMDDIAGWLMRF